MANAPQQFLHFGGRQYTPQAYLKAREAGELGAMVHADGSKTLLSGETITPIVAKRADDAIARTKEYNDSFDESVTSEEFMGPATLADPLLADVRDPEDLKSPETAEGNLPDSQEEVQPFTLEELRAQAKEKGIKGYHLYSYEKLLTTLYPQQ